MALSAISYNPLYSTACDFPLDNLQQEVFRSNVLVEQLRH